MDRAECKWTGNLLRLECVAWAEHSYLALDSVCSAHCEQTYAGGNTGHDEVLEERPDHDLEDSHVHGCCIGVRTAHPRRNTLLESPSF